VPDNVLRFARIHLRVHTTVELWVRLRDTVRVKKPYDVAKPDRLAARGMIKRIITRLD
jgi:hypothetical protein